MTRVLASAFDKHTVPRFSAPPLPLPMTTAMANNGNGIAGFIAELDLDDMAGQVIEDPTTSQQSITEDTKDTEFAIIKPNFKPNVEPESYVLLLVDACSHAVSRCALHTLLEALIDSQFTQEFVQRPTLPMDLRQVKELLHTLVTQYISLATQLKRSVSYRGSRICSVGQEPSWSS